MNEIGKVLVTFCPPIGPCNPRTVELLRGMVAMDASRSGHPAADITDMGHVPIYDPDEDNKVSTYAHAIGWFALVPE